MDKIVVAIRSVESCRNLLHNLISMYGEDLIKFSTYCQNSDRCGKILETLFGFEDDLKSVEEAVEKGFAPQLMLLGIVTLALAGSGYENRFFQRFIRIYREKFLDVASDDDILRMFRILGIDLEVSSKCFDSVPRLVTVKGGVVATCYRYRIPLKHYLKCARTLLAEHSWKLYSMYISKGYILIDSRKKVSRLLEEYLRVYLIDRVRILESVCAAEGVRGNIDVVNSLLEPFPQLGSIVIGVVEKLGKRGEEVLHRGRDVGVVGSWRIGVEFFSNIRSVDEVVDISQKLFPPCMKILLEALLRGENLSHHQRFALATFLLNLGMDIEVVLELFRHSPDFNERIARYQIEHLTGLRGSRKRYLTYSCESMRVLGMCVSDCGVKNPLQYVYRHTSKNASSRS